MCQFTKASERSDLVELHRVSRSLGYVGHVHHRSALLLLLRPHGLWILRRDLTKYWILRHLIGLWSKNGFDAVCLYDFGFFHCLFLTFWGHPKAHDPNLEPLRPKFGLRPIVWKPLLQGIKICANYHKISKPNFPSIAIFEHFSYSQPLIWVVFLHGSQPSISPLDQEVDFHVSGQFPMSIASADIHHRYWKADSGQISPYLFNVLNSCHFV